MLYQIKQDKDTLTLSLMGVWQKLECAPLIKDLKKTLQKEHTTKVVVEDCGISNWDSSILVVLYGLINAFPEMEFNLKKLPKNIQCLMKLSMMDHRHPQNKKEVKEPFFEEMGQYVLTILASVRRGLSFLQDCWKSIGRFFSRKAVYRSIDFWKILDECAPKAVGIVCLISLMVGLILAFVGAIQLKSFGAQIYISSLVTIGMTRIMGAIMIGIIMAGRTGASYAATIGTMQVNEELDALKTMGISRTDFLILPRLGALVFSMPFLVVLSDFMGMLGGAFVGIFMLDLSPEEYLQFSINAFNLTDFTIGILHGIVFGFVISLCGCYFGIKCGRDSGSVGIATTKAVVYSIVWMIVMTGLLTLIFEALGI